MAERDRSMSNWHQPVLVSESIVRKGFADHGAIDKSIMGC